MLNAINSHIYFDRQFKRKSYFSVCLIFNTPNPPANRFQYFNTSRLVYSHILPHSPHFCLVWQEACANPERGAGGTDPPLRKITKL